MNREAQTLIRLFLKRWSRPSLLETGTPDARRVNGLRQMKGELQALAGSTEEEFLSAGERLQQFYLQSKEIAKTSSLIAALMSGEEITEAIERLREIFDWVRCLEEASEKNAGVLKEILQRLDAIRDHVKSFNRSVRILNILGVSIRIESARLRHDDTGFHVLAEEVKKLAAEIESKSTDILDRSEFLSSLIGETFGVVSDLKARQQGQSKMIRDRTLSNINALSERHRLSSAAANRLSDQYEEISRSIGEVMASMQFHDITRQKIEHVNDAMEQAIQGQEEIGHDRQRPSSSEKTDALVVLGDVCQLQMAHLQNARDELVDAVDRIRNNLQRIADHVVEMSEETKSIGGGMGGANGSFLSETEQSLSLLKTALFEYAGINQRLSSAASQVASTAVDMASFVKDIERIGTKIERIALNACIKAAHIGQEGATLSVLSEAIQQLSADTREKTTLVAEGLQSVTSEAKAIATDKSLESQGRDAEARQKMQELEGSIGSLRRMNEEITSLSAQVEEKGGSLAEDIRETLSGLDAHQRVKEVTDGVLSGLDAILKESRARFPLTDTEARKDYLNRLEDRYTMNSEREIHQKFIGPQNHLLGKEVTIDSEMKDPVKEEVPALVEPLPKDDKEGFGDNVELF